MFPKRIKLFHERVFWHLYEKSLIGFNFIFLNFIYTSLFKEFNFLIYNVVWPLKLF